MKLTNQESDDHQAEEMSDIRGKLSGQRQANQSKKKNQKKH